MIGRNDTAVWVSPGPMVSLVDVIDGSQLDVAFDLGEGLVTEVCLSPTMQYLAVNGSTGQAVVVDLARSTSVIEFTTGQEFDALGWTSPNQLVYIDESRYVIAITVPEGNPAVVARLSHKPDQPISLTGSAAFC